MLSTHEGYDIGALDLFKSLRPVADVSFFSEDSRLLIELNRSEHHPKLFSKVTKSLSEEEKLFLIKNFYKPYREQVEHMVQDLVNAGRKVIHISVHSFTPELKGEVRQTDIGLLYDPKRDLEQTISKAWKTALQQADPSLTVRYNYPYLGIADGFPTYLRRKFTNAQYAGIELEVNQKFPVGDAHQWEYLKNKIRDTLISAVQPIITTADRDLA